MLPYLKKNFQNIVLILLIIGFGFSVYFLGQKTITPKLSSVSSPNQNQLADKDCQNNLIETMPVDLGNLPPYEQGNALIKIVEFSDYLCPFCAKTAVEFYPKIEPLIKNGEIAIFYRDFPVHPEARFIANAARCANEQKRFWDFNLEIFQKFAAGENIAQKDVWLNLSKELKLNQEQFNACLNNKYLQDVDNDFNYGSSLGVDGTPTFFIQSGGKAFKIVGIDEACLMSSINKLKDLNK